VRVLQYSHLVYSASSQLERYINNLIASKSVAIIFLAPRFDGDMGEEYWRERERERERENKLINKIKN
jgi:hypothetical protein